MQTATIVPARMTGMDRPGGSIEVGKDADMHFGRGGRRSKDLRDLRHMTTILNDGYRLDAAALREASGISGMPSDGQRLAVEPVLDRRVRKLQRDNQPFEARP